MQQRDELPPPRVAGRLLAQHRHLSRAPQHYVKAMVKLLTHELDRGLHPGHIARALERCVSDGEVGAHCELVRLAVRQAWGDQRAGACGECGADVGEHRMGCADRAAEVDASIDEEAAAEIHDAVLASLNSARASGALPEVGRQVQGAQAQPTGRLRCRRSGDPGGARSPQHLDLVDAAAAHLRLVLHERRAS